MSSRSRYKIVYHGSEPHQKITMTYGALEQAELEVAAAKEALDWVTKIDWHGPHGWGGEWRRPTEEDGT